MPQWSQCFGNCSSSKEETTCKHRALKHETFAKWQTHPNPSPKSRCKKRSISPPLSLYNTGTLGCSDTPLESYKNFRGWAGTGSHASAARMASWRQKSCGTSHMTRRWDVVGLSCLVGIGGFPWLGLFIPIGASVFFFSSKNIECIVMSFCHGKNLEAMVSFNMFGSMLKVGQGSWTWSLDHTFVAWTGRSLLCRLHLVTWRRDEKGTSICLCKDWVSIYVIRSKTQVSDDLLHLPNNVICIDSRSVVGPPYPIPSSYINLSNLRHWLLTGHAPKAKEASTFPWS